MAGEPVVVRRRPPFKRYRGPGWLAVATTFAATTTRQQTSGCWSYKKANRAPVHRQCVCDFCACCNRTSRTLDPRTIMASGAVIIFIITMACVISTIPAKPSRDLSPPHELVATNAQMLSVAQSDSDSFADNRRQPLLGRLPSSQKFNEFKKKLHKARRSVRSNDLDAPRVAMPDPSCMDYGHSCLGGHGR